MNIVKATSTAAMMLSVAAAPAMAQQGGRGYSYFGKVPESYLGKVPDRGADISGEWSAIVETRNSSGDRIRCTGTVHVTWAGLYVGATSARADWQCVNATGGNNTYSTGTNNYSDQFTVTGTDPFNFTQSDAADPSTADTFDVHVVDHNHLTGTMSSGDYRGSIEMRRTS
jgi:hypothetical protein